LPRRPRSASAAQVTCTGSIDLVAGGKISVALECPALTPSTPAGPTTPITPTQPPCQTMGGIPIGTGCGGTVGTLTPTTPPAGPATTPPTSTTSERAPYVQTRVGDILGGGFWRVSMAFPGEAHETAFSIGPGDGRRWMLDGDNGWQQGDLTVSVNGQPVDRGQAIFGPGNWRIRAEAVDNAHTREHGVGATAIQLFRIQ
jgi:hypothetical protein